MCMTIAQILKLKAEDLERLSDEELKKIFAPYLPETRKPLSAQEIKAAEMLVQDGLMARAKELLKRAESRL